MWAQGYLVEIVVGLIYQNAKSPSKTPKSGKVENIFQKYRFNILILTGSGEPDSKIVVSTIFKKKIIFFFEKTIQIYIYIYIYGAWSFSTPPSQCVPM